MRVSRRERDSYLDDGIVIDARYRHGVDQRGKPLCSCCVLQSISVQRGVGGPVREQPWCMVQIQHSRGKDVPRTCSGVWRPSK
jgi:hypothetical protein